MKPSVLRPIGLFHARILLTSPGLPSPWIGTRMKRGYGDGSDDCPVTAR